MNYTREPIIETIMTPKEGCKLVVRNSKGSGQEEFFVDALELVSFGPALFFRSMERPKNFLLPVSDYEVLEVRETRMVLKAVGPLEKGIKIGGGREVIPKPPRELPQEKESQLEEEDEMFEQETPAIGAVDVRLDKKRDRKRHRRRRGRGEREGAGEGTEESAGESQDEMAAGESSEEGHVSRASGPSSEIPIPTPFATILPPPSTLISETIAKYRGNAEFRKAFFIPSEEDSLEASERPAELFEESKIEKEVLAEELSNRADVAAEKKEEEPDLPPFHNDFPVLPKSPDKPMEDNSEEKT